jgi:TPR repeat protein
VKQDVRAAVRWFCKAARQGDKTAQHNLGVYYANLEAAEKATSDEGAEGENAEEEAGEAAGTEKG